MSSYSTTTETLTGKIQVRNGASMFKQQILVLQVECLVTGAPGFASYKYWRDATHTDPLDPNFPLEYANKYTIKTR